MKPTIGRIVLYRGRLGLQCLRPAIITCTRDTLNPTGVLTGMIRDLDSDTHLHLHVFTPSEQGAFTEMNVPQSPNPTDPEPGTWIWPPRV